MTASRYESVAAMMSFSPSNRTRIPVNTGRDSSREAARLTRPAVSSTASASTDMSSTVDASGRRGNPLRCRCGADTSPRRSRSRRCPRLSDARSRHRPPGAGARDRQGACWAPPAPSDSTLASSEDRSEISMSVAASSSRPSPARSSSPASTAPSCGWRQRARPRQVGE